MKAPGLLCRVIIIDNSPHSYIFQPDNALPIGTFIDDPDDGELLDILPVLQVLVPHVPSSLQNAAVAAMLLVSSRSPSAAGCTTQMTCCKQMECLRRLWSEWKT